MAIEIERRFEAFNSTSVINFLNEGEYIIQGYLNHDRHRTVRVRTVDDKAAFITIKGLKVLNTSPEFEYEIPIEDGRALLGICQHHLVEKTRVKYEFEGFIWDVDKFWNDNAGLMTAEIELKFADQEFPRPPWLGKELTHDHRYSNSSLSLIPFSLW